VATPLIIGHAELTKRGSTGAADAGEGREGHFNATRTTRLTLKPTVGGAGANHAVRRSEFRRTAGPLMQASNRDLLMRTTDPGDQRLGGRI